MALPRTGSTNIRKYIQQTNHFTAVFNEPFNPQIEPALTWPIFSYKEVMSYDNIFVKGMFWHLPKEFKDSTLDIFYQQLIIDFDKVIFLSRKNIYDISVSLSTAQLTGVWHLQYVENVITIDDDYLKNTINYISDKDEKMKMISEKFNIPIYYYEDIFNNEDSKKHFLENVLNVPFFPDIYKKTMDKSCKYKIKKQIKSII